MVFKDAFQKKDLLDGKLFWFTFKKLKFSHSLRASAQKHELVSKKLVTYLKPHIGDDYDQSTAG